jgi:(p)ppGpp synthase/HD superfamily hydrolase
LIFPLQGVDSQDDDALDAFAHRAWQAATHEWENTMNDQPGPSTALTDKYTAAISYATALHGATERKGTKITYMCHLIGVSGLVLEAGGSQDEAIAGLLHDAVEDAGGLPRLADIRARFGDTVADIVLVCTDSVDEKWKKSVDYCTRKQQYLDHLEHPDTDPRAVLVSIADKVHNARATVTDVHRYGVEVLDKFNTPTRRSVVWYYTELLRIAKARGVTEALTVPLGIAVCDLQSRVDGPWECA